MAWGRLGCVCVCVVCMLRAQRYALLQHAVAVAVAVAAAAAVVGHSYRHWQAWWHHDGAAVNSGISPRVLTVLAGLSLLPICLPECASLRQAGRHPDDCCIQTNTTYVCSLTATDTVSTAEGGGWDKGWQVFLQVSHLGTCVTHCAAHACVRVGKKGARG